MGDVVQFKRPKLAQLHKGKTLCRSGFHKWEVLKEKQFDVKQGKLITVYQCTRCAKSNLKRCRRLGVSQPLCPMEGPSNDSISLALVMADDK